MSEIISWAENEVKIACEKERAASGVNDGDWDYGCACYDSALKALKSLSEDGHSGMSISFTKHILNRLIDHKPLTPIEDTDDVWEHFHRNTKEGYDAYQCTRMSALFKHVYDDGTVTYDDVDRVVCYDTDSDVPFSNGLSRDIVNEMFPITMPYMPVDKPYRMYLNDILTDAKNGDFDTRHIHYVITPDDRIIMIDRYFKEGEDDWIEIDEAEWNERKMMDQERLWKEVEEIMESED